MSPISGDEFLEKGELRFGSRCRGDSLKGLKTEALLVKRYRIASLLDAIDFTRSCYSSLFALKIFVLFIWQCGAICEK